MRVLALITCPQKCHRILLRLIKSGAAPWARLSVAPPGLDTSALN